MIGWAWVVLVNIRRAIQNGLRRLFTRKVPYLLLRLEGPLPEFTDKLTYVQRRLRGGQQPLSMQAVRETLRRIAADPRVPGIVIKHTGMGGGFGTLEAFHQELARFKESGKRVVSLVMAHDTLTYLAACTADAVWIPPSSTLFLPGLRREGVFLKDALARLGVEAEIFAVSPFKAAGEALVRTDFSPENREQLDRLLGGRFEAIIAIIAKARKRSPDEVRAWFDHGILGADAALKLGMVDALVYEDQLGSELTTEKETAKVVGWGQGSGMVLLPYARRAQKFIGVIKVHGTITAGSSRELPVPLPVMGQEQAGADSVIQALRQAEHSARVAGVVLHVDTPGGDAFASDLMWREVARLEKKKPVVVCMHNVAASGGYYIAAPARHIVAQAGTLTGSIGVIGMRFNVEGLLKMLSVHVHALTRGKNTGLLSVNQPLNDDERKAMHDSIYRSYEEFLSRVKDGRKISDETLRPLAGGRVWNGREALAHGLVDSLGGFPEALMKAQELAGLPKDIRGPYAVLKVPARAGLLPAPWKDAAEAVAPLLTPRLWALLPWDL